MKRMRLTLLSSSDWLLPAARFPFGDRAEQGRAGSSSEGCWKPHPRQGNPFLPGAITTEIALVKISFLRAHKDSETAAPTQQRDRRRRPGPSLWTELGTAPVLWGGATLVL